MVGRATLSLLPAVVLLTLATGCTNAGAPEPLGVDRAVVEPAAISVSASPSSILPRADRPDPTVVAIESAGVAVVASEDEPSGAPPRLPPSVVAHVAVPEIPVFRQPGGDPLTSFTMKGTFGEPRVFLVREARGRWLRVLLPIRPNGVQGWIRSRDVRISRHRFAVGVDLSERRLTLSRGANVILRRKVAVGGPESPTPTGLFFTTILATANDPSGPYGPFAYGLSGFSEVFTEFAGGNGQIAIHGTNAPHLIGQAVSAGCIRMRNEDMLRVARLLPVGTPVRIAR